MSYYLNIFCLASSRPIWLIYGIYSNDMKQST